MTSTTPSPPTLAPQTLAENAPERALLRAEWQPALFGPLRRTNLLGLAPTWPLREVRVLVHRNHGFEPLVAPAQTFAAWNGLRFDFVIGAYDDSLAAPPDLADVVLVWLDTERYAKLAREELAAWLRERLAAVRASTSAPIVVAAWPLDPSIREKLEAAALPGVHLADVDALAVEVGARWIDGRATKITGSRLSDAAWLRVARELACRWIPAAVLPPIKAIAVDADGTLYDGVLAEDGAGALRLTDGHRRLQEGLKRLVERGVLLALVSRNERADVEALFPSRSDFPLRRDDFADVDVSWGDKADAIERAADRLRIGVDSFVFVDDNPGELAAVASRLPVVTVHAQPDAAQTVIAVDHVAGLWRWRRSAEDAIRAGDLRTSDEREGLARAATSPSAYLLSLGVRLAYALDARPHLARAADLAQKTNQFNLALRRMPEAELAARMEEPGGAVVVIGLQDRLSDSGIIGVVVGARHDDVLRVEEVCVSCRALGRHLEDGMLTRALTLMAEADPPEWIVFEVAKGPRNGPARDWLEGFAGVRLADDAHELRVPFAMVRAKVVDPAIAIVVTR